MPCSSANIFSEWKHMPSMAKKYSVPYWLNAFSGTTMESLLDRRARYDRVLLWRAIP